MFFTVVLVSASLRKATRTKDMRTIAVNNASLLT